VTAFSLCCCVFYECNLVDYVRTAYFGLAYFQVKLTKERKAKTAFTIAGRNYHGDIMLSLLGCS